MRHRHDYSRHLIAFTLATSLAVLMNCGGPKVVRTPAAAAAQTADNVVLQIGELQTAAIDANRSGLLPDKTAIAIVRFCVDANTRLRDHPSDWRGVVGDAYHALRNSLTASEQAKLTAALAVLDLIFGATA
jgi:hypothetical protein